MTKNFVFLSAAIAAAILTGCAPAPAPDTRAADEAAIRKADEAWVKTTEAKSVDGWVSFYSDDAVALPPNEKVATSKESIRKSIDGLMALPGLKMSWKASKVEVAKSGDVAFLYGAYELSFKDPKGNTITDNGKMVEIWKKQADGGWKCAVDIWNSDTPLTPPPPPAK